MKYTKILAHVLKGVQLSEPLLYGISRLACRSIVSRACAQVDWMLLIELLIDIFFLSDIALNFNTGYISEQARHSSVSMPPFDLCATN